MTARWTLGYSTVEPSIDIYQLSDDKRSAKQICNIPIANRREEQEAAARLIAAAPELLEALTGLMWRFDADDTDVNAPAETSPDILASRAAIAKATQ